MADRGHEPSRLKGVLLLGAIFVLGMLCGAALFHIGQRSVLRALHGGPHGAPLRELARSLDLDPGQRERIAEILRDSRHEVHRTLESTHAEIRELLRPEQKERFDRFRPRHGPHGGHPDPPPPSIE